MKRNVFAAQCIADVVVKVCACVRVYQSLACTKYAIRRLQHWCVYNNKNGLCANSNQFCDQFKWYYTSKPSQKFIKIASFRFGSIWERTHHQFVFSNIVVKTYDLSSVSKMSTKKFKKLTAALSRIRLTSVVFLWVKNVQNYKTQSQSQYFHSSIYSFNLYLIVCLLSMYKYQRRQWVWLSSWLEIPCDAKENFLT